MYKVFGDITHHFFFYLFCLRGTTFSIVHVYSSVLLNGIFLLDEFVPYHKSYVFFFWYLNLYYEGMKQWWFCY